MAYSSTVDPVRKGQEILVTITETEAQATSEASVIELGVKKFRILRQICTLDSGSGSTVNPIIGSVTNPAGTPSKVVVENATAAASISNQITGGASGYSATGNLYHRSRVDSGSDNTITTEYHLLVGWDG